MPLHRWLGIGAIALLAAFVWFTFRQGLKVKPDARADRGPGVGTTSGEGGGSDSSGADHPG